MSRSGRWPCSTACVARLLALRWSDVDLESGASRSNDRGRSPAASRWRRPPPRAGGRAGTLPPAVVAYLREWKEMQAAHIAECLEQYEDHGLVCCSPNGRPWYPTTLSHNFCVWSLQPACPRRRPPRPAANLCHVALRRESLAAVAEVLGHADRTTTLEIYQDVHADQHTAVAHAVQDAVMPHMAVDVTSNVTSTAQDAKTASSSRPFLLNLWYARGDSNAKPLDPQGGHVSAALLMHNQDALACNPVSAPPEETECHRLAQRSIVQSSRTPISGGHSTQSSTQCDMACDIGGAAQR